MSMMFSDYDALFEQYLVNIALNSSQSKLIDSKLEETSSLFLGEYDGDVDIYAQGSYAMGTSVKPLTASQSGGNPGEYDVDIVLERASWIGASDALESVRGILSTEYGSSLDRKLRETCERVNHDVEDQTGVSFHVDYVPIKLTPNARSAAKRSEDKWFLSDTKELIAWFKEYSSRSIFLPSLILILKRARDFAGLTDSLPSILVTALVCKHYEDRKTYAGDLMNILEKVNIEFAVPYSVSTLTIPVVNENLMKKITESDFHKIKDFFQDMFEAFERGLPEGNLSILQDFLSADFPGDWSKMPPFLEALRNRGWGLELDGSLNIVDIEGSSAAGSQKSRRRWSFFGSGAGLEFRVSGNFDKSLYGIRWQVLNSEESGGSHRRGDLFEAKSRGGGKNSNEFINYETEQYNGEHWIKYYIYNKQTKKVEEIGRKFYVEVDKEGGA